MKRFKALMIAGLMIVSIQLIGSGEKDAVSCDQEKLLINSYIVNHWTANNGYNDLIHRWFDNDLSSSEKKCMIDAKIAQKKTLYPWGFQWIAGLMVRNNDFDFKMGVGYARSEFQEKAQEHYRAMLFKTLNSHKAIVINQTLDTIARYGSKGECHDYRTRDYQDKMDLRNHVTKLITDRARSFPVDPYGYKYQSCGTEDCQKFSKNLWSIIKNETADEQKARLKKENIREGYVPNILQNRPESLAGLKDRTLEIAGLFYPLAEKLEKNKGWFDFSSSSEQPKVVTAQDEPQIFISAKYNVVTSTVVKTEEQPLLLKEVQKKSTTKYGMEDGVVRKRREDGSWEVLSTGHNQKDPAEAFKELYKLAKENNKNK